MRYRDYMEMFPSGFRPYSNPQDDSDNVSLPDSERQRLYQESQSTWRDYAANPLSFGATPLTGNIPTFQQWAAGNPEIIGDNSPEYQYLQQFYQLPNKSDIWETVLPMAAMAAMGATAGGAFGNLGTGEFAGMGTFGTPASSAVGAAPTAAPAATTTAAPSAGGVSMTEAQALQNSLFPATTSAAPAINTAAPAFGSALGSVGAPNLGFALPGMGVNLANSAELIAGAGSAAAGAGALSGAAGAAQTAGNALTQPTTGTTFGIPNNILAGGLQGLLGYLGAGQQADAFQDVYNQQSAIGAPYRNLLQASYQPGFTMANEPGYKDALDLSTDSFLRAASAGRAPGVSGGNPFSNPGAWAETMKYVNSSLALPQLNTYRGQLGQFGGMGLNTAGAASLGGAQTAGGGLDAIGYGLGTIFNPQPNYADIFKQMGGGFKLNNGSYLP
jgi:hypothetical protein